MKSVRYVVEDILTRKVLKCTKSLNILMLYMVINVITLVMSVEKII